MNSLPSIELHETYSEQDTASIHQNLSCQHNTILTDRTFQNFPKLSGDRFAFSKKTPKELYNNASVTTADATDFRCSLQDICPNGFQIPPSTNILDKDETKYAVDPSQEIPEDASVDKSLSMIQPTNNQDIPMINTEAIIPVDLEIENNNVPDPVVPENIDIPVVLPVANVTEADAEIGRQSRAGITQILEFYLLLGVFYLLGYLSLNGFIPYFTLLIFSSLVCVTKVIMNLIHAEHHERYRKALDWISLSMIVIAASIRIRVPDLPLIPFAFPGFICTILFWQIARPRTFYLKKENVVALRFLFWTQILLITLKLDSYISSWNFVFLMLFYLFVFIMSFSVGIFLIATVYICQTLRIRSLDHTIVGLLWDFMNTLFAWIWGFGILSVINKLDNQTAPFLIPCIILGFAHVVILGIYTILFRHILAEHLALTFGLNRNDGEQAGNQRYSFETVRENIAYLVRVSSTYFTRMDEGFKVQDKQQAQAWKQHIFNAKMEKYHNKNLDLALAYDNLEKKTHEKKKSNQKSKEEEIILPLKNHSFQIYKAKNLFGASAEQTGDANLTSKMSYSQDDIDIVREIKRPPLKNDKSEEGNDENQCIVCFEAPSDAVFMGCGHGGLCHNCALEVWKRGDTCVFCRNDIQEILRVSYIPGVGVAKVIEGTKRTIVFD